MKATDEITGCYGKKYHGEKACIALTSWTARISTCGKTIYNLYETCPGFHIVLTLAEEEFPGKERSLPNDLITMADCGIFEILWVKHNWKAMKKVLFCMAKYPSIPTISADDDCLYTCNYAEQLYDIWLKSPHSIISCETHSANSFIYCRGPGVLYYPCCFKCYGIEWLQKIHNFSNDDAYISALIKKLAIHVIDGNMPLDTIIVFHDTIMPSSTIYKYSRNDIKLYYNMLV